MRRIRGEASRVRERQRSEIAHYCARLIVDDGFRDHAQALRKAAEHFGVRGESALPRPPEIEQAVRDRQGLFGGERQPLALRRARSTAVEAMRFLAEFRPRLTGAALDGTADQHSAVVLHLFSDDPDAVIRKLQDQRIPHISQTRQLRFGGDRSESYPSLAFWADQVQIELVVLPLNLLRQAPMDRSGHRPMARANLSDVLALLDGDGSRDPPDPGA